MRSIFLWAILFLGCTKSIDAPPAGDASVDASGFRKYVIRMGDHYTTYNPYRPIATTAFVFIVRFDSSAVYKSVQAENQFDINKLYGFSDNGAAHHQYSARLGWRWSSGAVRLFAYVYNAGHVVSEELGPVPIGTNITCRIEVSGARYLFSCNEWQKTLPRASTTALGTGYVLYPYFGGDETAPHDIAIWIKDV